MSLDRDGFHQLLWIDAHSIRHSLRLNQSEYAKAFRVNNSTVSRAVKAMAGEGRIVKIGHDIREATYRVVDPVAWKEGHDSLGG